MFRVGGDAARRRWTVDADQYFPGISVADNGRVDLAWYDFRNDQFFSPGELGDMGTSVGQRYWDVYYASSQDKGRTWSPNPRVTQPSIDAKLGVTFNNNDTRGPMGIASADEGGLHHLGRLPGHRG